MTLKLRLTYAARALARTGPVARARANALVKTERLAPAEIERRQDVHLAQTLAWACQTIPAYRMLLPRLPASGLRSFLANEIAIVSKADLLAQRSRFYPNDGVARAWWPVGKTSGTTGSPLDVFRSFDSTLWEQAFHLQHWMWAGYRWTEPQVVLRGDLVVPVERSSPPFWFQDRLGRQLFVSTRHLNRTAVPAIAAAIRRFGAAQLRAYPSAALELSRLTAEMGLDVRFRSIVTGSEYLDPAWRETIERVFGGRVYDFYGMAERVAFAAECEHGGMHVNPEYSYVEIVDDYGRPTEGEGYVVGTTFHNSVMPLIRYRLTDRTRWKREPCSCGRNYALVEAFSGKFEDRVFDMDGVVVSPSIITFAFKGVANVQKAQVAQVAQDEWVLRLVPGRGYSAADGQTLLSNFDTLVSKRLRVRIELKDDIPNLPSGKFKWVTQEWRCAAPSFSSTSIQSPWVES